MLPKFYCMLESPSMCVHAKWLQSCLTLCNPMDCSPPGSSVHGDSPGKNSGVGCDGTHLPWGDFPHPGIEPTSPMSSALAVRFFNTCTTWEAQNHTGGLLKHKLLPGILRVPDSVHLGRAWESALLHFYHVPRRGWSCWSWNHTLGITDTVSVLVNYC